MTNWKTYNGQTRGWLRAAFAASPRLPTTIPDLLHEHHATAVERIGECPADHGQRQQAGQDA